MDCWFRTEKTKSLLCSVTTRSASGRVRTEMSGSSRPLVLLSSPTCCVSLDLVCIIVERVFLVGIFLFEWRKNTRADSFLYHFLLLLWLWIPRSGQITYIHTYFVSSAPCVLLCLIFTYVFLFFLLLDGEHLVYLFGPSRKVLECRAHREGVKQP